MSHKFRTFIFFWKLRISLWYLISGYYFSGDGARRDEDGHYHITGRVDDVINVKGVRIGTAEIEDVMVRIVDTPCFIDCWLQVETSVLFSWNHKWQFCNEKTNKFLFSLLIDRSIASAGNRFLLFRKLAFFFTLCHKSKHLSGMV